MMAGHRTFVYYLGQKRDEAWGWMGSDLTSSLGKFEEARIQRVHSTLYIAPPTSHCRSLNHGNNEYIARPMLEIIAWGLELN